MPLRSLPREPRSPWSPPAKLAKTPDKTISIGRGRLGEWVGGLSRGVLVSGHHGEPGLPSLHSLLQISVFRASSGPRTGADSGTRHGAGRGGSRGWAARSCRCSLCTAADQLGLGRRCSSSCHRSTASNLLPECRLLHGNSDSRSRRRWYRAPNSRSRGRCTRRHLPGERRGCCSGKQEAQALAAEGAAPWEQRGRERGGPWLGGCDRQTVRNPSDPVVLQCRAMSFEPLVIVVERGPVSEGRSVFSAVACRFEGRCEPPP